MQMRGRFKAYFWVFLLLFLIGVSSLYFVGIRPSPVTKKNFDRIKDGMTKEDVIFLLGKPDTMRFIGAVNEGTEVWNEGRNPKTSSGAMIQVDFDGNDRVIGRAWFPPQGDQLNLLGRLIEWFKDTLW